MKTRFPKVLRQQIEDICYEYGITHISWDDDEYIDHLIHQLYQEPLLHELSECFHTFMDRARLKLSR